MANTMNAQTTQDGINKDLMFELSKLLEKHGSRAVIEALRDAADAAADHAIMAIEPGWAGSVEDAFRAASESLAEAAERIEQAEDMSTKQECQITLDAACSVLADC